MHLLTVGQAHEPCHAAAIGSDAGAGRSPARLTAPGTVAGNEATPAGPKPGAILAARERAAGCLARDFDGKGFRDPYLRYVYPEESLPAPASDPGLTYRRVDADAMLAFLDRTGNVPEPLKPAVRSAWAVLDELPPLWRQAGLSNVRRGAKAGGIALDTYCIVGWLLQDRVMAGEVARALDGSGWLPAGLYDGEEEFRRDADEAWCVRLLASPAGRHAASYEPALDRLVSSFRAGRQGEPAGRQTFYRAYHLGLVLEEAPGNDSIDAGVKLAEELVGAFRQWAASRKPGEEEPSDILEWANLASSTLLKRDSGEALRRRALQVLLSLQGEDGCWRIPGAGRAEYGTSFTTLRALLALSAYRAP